MEKNNLISWLFLLILLAILCFCVMLYMIRQDSIKCVANPSSYFYKALEKNNPNTIVFCSCSLSKGSESITIGLNESGEYLVRDDRIMVNRYGEGLNISIRH